MRDLYMKNGQGFVLVYSITAQSTFNDLQDLREQILRVKDTTDVSDQHLKSPHDISILSSRKVRRIKKIIIQGYCLDVPPNCSDHCLISPCDINTLSHLQKVRRIEILNLSLKSLSCALFIYQVPMVLVGNKCDLEDERVVGKDQGQNLAKNFNNW